MKILIVEDDYGCRTVLKLMLTQLGQVDMAENGREAVDFVKQSIQSNTHYDLICMDIMMPVMDGERALQLVREAEEQAGIEGLKRSKIIMTTALNGADNIIESFKDECDGYIIKPVEWKQLAKTFNTVGIETPESWKQFIKDIPAQD